MEDISEGLVSKVLAKAKTLDQDTQHWIAVYERKNVILIS
jgi:hypothetical protein